jgi:hypothetical protein
MTDRIAAFLLFVGVVAAPAVAFACPVCFSGEDEARHAYVEAALLMTILPLATIGGFVWWIRRRIRAHEAEEAPPPRPVRPARFRPRVVPRSS